MLDIRAMIGPRVESLQEYAPEPLPVLAQRLGRSVDELIKLDANENPYGPTDYTLERLRAFDQYHRYPDAQSRELRQAIGAYADVDPNSVLVGNGSDELIDLVLKVFRPEPRSTWLEVINCPPTFGMYAFYAATNDLRLLEIPRKPDFSLDLEWIGAACADGTPRLLFVTSPNNPDGRPLPDEALQTLLALPLVVILDEAYIEFGGASRAAWVAEHDNLIVLRTFSKWAGLAGLRVGYGIFSQPLMDALTRLKSPYNVNIVAQEAALATLASLDEARVNVARLVSERERLYQELQGLPFVQPVPSSANYVLVRSSVPVERLRDVMERHGIILRYFAGTALQNHVRISAGTPAQTDALLTALRELA
ncbi:MAG: histidinol-phosphate transaminase [Chloroflexi bacterium]|jgi:histidinol-phosphate aminotransferase|nr:histidinol-phosphate transaminase [Chloroflexota bacterium]